MRLGLDPKVVRELPKDESEERGVQLRLFTVSAGPKSRQGSASAGPNSRWEAFYRSTRQRDAARHKGTTKLQLRRFSIHQTSWCSTTRRYEMERFHLAPKKSSAPWIIKTGRFRHSRTCKLQPGFKRGTNRRRKRLGWRRQQQISSP